MYMKLRPRKMQPARAQNAKAIMRFRQDKVVKAENSVENCAANPLRGPPGSEEEASRVLPSSMSAPAASTAGAGAEEEGTWGVPVTLLDTKEKNSRAWWPALCAAALALAAAELARALALPAAPLPTPPLPALELPPGEGRRPFGLLRVPPLLPVLLLVLPAEVDCPFVFPPIHVGIMAPSDDLMAATEPAAVVLLVAAEEEEEPPWLLLLDCSAEPSANSMRDRDEEADIAMCG
jgi:hypothetical protein